MRATRPTLRVVGDLPANPSVLAARSVISRAKAADNATAAQVLQELRLEQIESALLRDADRSFADGGTQSRHEEGTAAFHATVYEVRDHEGAGWRGAVILDSDGDPWLVFVAPHDKFHSSVAKALKRDKGVLQKSGETEGAAANYLPTNVDYLVRRTEEARLQELEVQRDLIAALRDGLRSAHASGAAITARTPADPLETGPAKFVEYTVEICHDEPADTVEEANLSTSTVTLIIPLGAGSHRMRNLLISCGVLYVQPDTNYHEQVYTKSNALRLDLSVTHAKLAQLLSDADIDDADFPPSAAPPDRLHWVHSPDHIEGVVTGVAVRSLCGSWFVPTQDENADLPVCTGCETIHPLAKEMLDQLRLRAYN